MLDSLTPEPPPAGRLLALSPHLDDAAFACGRLLASVPGATVATVFAGRPAPGAPLTDWDRAAGFADGDDVLALRREEDRQALEILGAHPRWLELRDSQYGGPDLETVTAALEALFTELRPDAVLAPLGLFHSDHRLAHQGALAFLDDLPGCRWLLYEDALYRRIGGLRDRAIDGLCRQGLPPRPLRFEEGADADLRKHRAVACYRSQLRALATPGRPGVADLDQPEAYWELYPTLRVPP